MCGIVGIIKLNKQKVQQEELRQFRDAIKHRGPNGYGEFFDGPIAFGHRRLSVLDVSDLGAQPMSYADGRYTIVYNGEVYNFLELRSELKTYGYSFVSDSDTEVILAAYDKWGKDCLLKFNGMWAFVIWDRKEQKLFFARDRYGVKPLYYTYAPGEFFAFASETLAFDTLHNFKKEINEDHLYSTLKNNFALDARGLTIYKDIYHVRAGHCIEWDMKGAPEQKRWWNPTDHFVEVPKTYEEQVEQFRSLFEDACRLRLRSDVQVASALSGGVDSSAVYTMVNKIMHEGTATRVPSEWQKAFVASFPGSSLDERVFAEKVVTSVKGNAEYISIDAKDVLADLESSVEHFDAIHVSPLSVIGEIYKRMSEKGVIVSLDGHGVDEMMYGYPDLVREVYLQAHLFNQIERKNELAGIIHGMYDNADMAKALTTISISKLRILLRQYKHLIPSFLRPGNSPNTWLRERVYTLQTLGEDKMMLHKREPWLWENFYETVLPTLLRNFDRVSMRYSIEIRMPFMDYRLVNFIFSLPEKSKVGNGYTKRVLRDSMKGIMPEEIRTRTRKIGINAPIHEWFSHELKDYIHDVVHSESFQNSTIWNGQEIAAFVDDRNAKGKWSWDDAIRVWPYINAYIIKKKY